MGFDMRHDPCREELLALVEASEDVEAWTPWRRGLSGDLVVILLPRELLVGVLEPLTNALAARLRFSLERFSDVYLVTREIAAHAQSTASSGRISFALRADDGQLDLTIGPLRGGAGRQLGAHVTGLADELVVEPIEAVELLKVALRDGNRISRAVAG